MVNYKKDLIELIKDTVDDIPVMTQYPDSNIIPAVFIYETSNVLISNFTNSEHVSVSFIIEVYAKDITTRDEIVNIIDNILLKAKFVRTLLEEADNSNLYAKKLGYKAELKEDKLTGIIKIYNNN